MILYHTNIHTYRKRYAAFVFANDSTRLDCPWIHRWMFRHVDEVFGKSMEEEGGVLLFFFLKEKVVGENLRLPPKCWKYKEIRSNLKN